MTTKNPYSWMASLAALHWQREQANAKKPHLTLVTTDQAPAKTRKPKVKSTPAHEAKKPEMTDIIKEAFADLAPPSVGPIYQKLSNLRLEDHAHMVHNALDAVRSLVIPSSGTGISPSGYPENLAIVSRNSLVDLLEIINDRLGTALEMQKRGLL